MCIRDSTTTASTNYTITSGDHCAFLEWGGILRFRQVQNGLNQIRLEITPTVVNIPTTLSVTGGATVRGMLSTDDVVINKNNPGDPYGRLTGPSATHAIILRGDATGLGENTYAITPGGATCFVEWGGMWKFRQVRNTTNDVRFEVTPTFVSIPGSLRVGGYTAGMRPFVSCAVRLDGVRYWTRGQQTATTARTFGGSAFGDYTVTWLSLIHI